jgi:carboxyl-terminal processing protease
VNDFKKTTKVESSNKRNASIVKVLGACIFVCVVFCAGFMVRGNTDLLNAMGFSSLDIDTETNPGLTVSGDTYDSLSARVAEMEGVLKKSSMDDYDLGQVTTKVLSSYAESTGDPFLKYYDETSYRAYLASTKNPEAGIGVLFGENEGKCFASDVFEDSSAAAAGIETGDYVQSIDGVSKSSWSIPEVLDALSRSEGESVYVTWNRPSQKQGENGTTFSTTLTFSSSSQDNVTWSVRDGVCTIDVKQITSDSASMVQNALNDSTSKGAQAFVLDLRDVPGGYLTQAVDIASLFIQNGVVVQIETVSGTTSRSAAGDSVSNAPLVVITNGRTAGCAEVLAAALQESGRAEIVGEKTQGKGSIQAMQPLSFGGAIRYTAAYYLTPSGRQIDGNGITPNVETSHVATQDSVAFDSARSQIS